MFCSMKFSLLNVMMIKWNKNFKDLTEKTIARGIESLLLNRKLFKMYVNFFNLKYFSDFKCKIGFAFIIW